MIGNDLRGANFAIAKLGVLVKVTQRESSENSGSAENENHVVGG